MSSARLSNYRRSVNEHFEPESNADPQAQRRLRGQLEQIDYTAYISNREVVGQVLGPIDIQRFERLGVATAMARGRWVAAALAATDGPHAPSLETVQNLTHLRTAYQELADAYDGMRRMVERGYLTYTTPA